MAGLIALATAGVLSAYSELAPVLAFAAAGGVAVMLIRAWRRGKHRRFAGFAAWSLLALMLFGHVEWVRAVHALRGQLGANVGWPLPWSAGHYSSFALGIGSYVMRDQIVWYYPWLTVVAAALLLVGLWMARRRLVALLPLLVLVLIAIPTAWQGKNWALFKLCQWAFPFVVCVQAAGLWLLLRRLPLNRALILLPLPLALLLSARGLYVHGAVWREILGSMAGPSKPIRDWRAAADEIRRRGAEHVVLVGVEDAGSLKDALAYYFDPLPIYTPWQGGSYTFLDDHGTSLGARRGQPAVVLWGKLPFAEGHIVYARAVGNARRGDTTAARQGAERLEKLAASATDPRYRYFAQQMGLQREGVLGLIEFVRGNRPQAIAMLRSAAVREDSLGKHPVSPGAILPIRELLADCLLGDQKPAEALIEYQASLKIYPGRFNATYGAGLAAERAGSRVEAKKYYNDLLALAKDGDGGRAEIALAQKSLQKYETGH
jgi:tetratricopeptide (TPR) repeat protein